MFTSLFLRGPALAALFALLGACSPVDAPPLDQQLYVWQRQWTAAHDEALAHTRDDFSTLRVLALQAFPGDGWRRARVEGALLKRDGRPLIAVIRLDGQLPALDSQDITAHIQQLLADWQALGLNVTGVEIDHDAGNARLAGYGAFLQGLRASLPPRLKLSITALPAWLASPDLPALLHSVDSSVLQVHAVSRPELGLFDPAQAKTWAASWSRVTDKPFYLALPAYGVGLLTSGSGAPLVESEVPLERPGQRRELMADPVQLAALAAQLRQAPPAHLAGLIWFRLPLAGDRRAWSLATLRAVARGDALHSPLQLHLSERAGLYDIRLGNDGNLDSPLPERLELAVGECEAVDALAGYAVQRNPGQLVFTRLQQGRLPAGALRAIGWARCTKIDQGASHVRL